MPASSSRPAASPSSSCCRWSGRLLGKVDVRLIIGVGLVVSIAALYHMGCFWPGSSYMQFMWARVFQAVGFAFLFIPINTVAVLDDFRWLALAFLVLLPLVLLLKPLRRGNVEPVHH